MRAAWCLVTGCPWTAAEGADLYSPARHEATATPSTPTPAPPASLTAWRHLIPGDCPLYLYLFVVQLLHDAAAEDLQGSHDIKLLGFNSLVHQSVQAGYQVCPRH